MKKRNPTRPAAIALLLCASLFAASPLMAHSVHDHELGGHADHEHAHSHDDGPGVGALVVGVGVILGVFGLVAIFRRRGGG